MSISPQQYAHFFYELLLKNPRKYKKTVINFIAFVVSKKDQNLIPEIIDAISDMIDHKNHTLFMNIVSSSPIEKSDQIAQAISKKIDQPVEISNIVDDKLIGGLIVYSSDWKIDFSIQSILQKKMSTPNQTLPNNIKSALEIIKEKV